MKELEEVLVATVPSEIASMDEDISAHLCDLVELMVASVGVRDNYDIKFFARLALHVNIF